MTIKKAMTIAGSDTSGGAGLEADLKTFQELGVYGMTAITCIVTMDPNGWHHRVAPIDVDLVQKQMETILSVGIDAMKTGMLGTVDIIELTAKKIDEHKLEKVVIDPVMVCKGEDEVLNPETAEALRDLLVPRALVVTPNLFEAGQLAGMKTPHSLDEMKAAAEKIFGLGAKNVLIKGGSKLQTEDKSLDLLFDGKEFKVYESEKIETSFTHGAGCTNSSAITAELAKGKSVYEAIQVSKDFVSAGIQQGFRLNEYVGPTWHGAYRSGMEK